MMPDNDDDSISIWVELPLDGIGFANDDEFDLREELEEQIDARDIGMVAGAGSGGGWMDVSFYTSNGDTALIALRELLIELQVVEHVRLRIYDYGDDDEGDEAELPVYEPGECLSFRFKDGEYGAGIVLMYQRLPLLGILDYKAVQPPTLDIFEARQWLVGTHPMWRGKPFLLWYSRKRGVPMLRIGSSPLRATDPTTSQLHLYSAKLGDYVLREKQRHTLQ
jgi:hypothetical protein